MKYKILTNIRAAECVSGFLVVCFPEMSFLINRKSRQRNYPRPPGQSYGTSEGRTQAQNQSRKMASYGGEREYYELDDDAVYGVRISPSGSNTQLTEAAANSGGVQVHHEITVESTRKEDFVR